MMTEITTLPNGFRIISETMPGLKSAAVGVWIRAGARNEAPDQNGIAHFLEHLAFKGTKQRSALDIAQSIENVGGYINAYTSKEVTAYYVRVLDGDVALGVDVLADILRNPLFSEADINAERGVILQEIGQTLDTPDDVIFDWLQGACYPNQAMGRTILGPGEHIERFQEDDFRNFVGEYYAPSEMVLSGAGGVDHSQLVDLAKSLFGDMPARQPQSWEKAQFVGNERREIKDLEQSHFALALPSAGYLDDDIYTARIYALCLGGGMSSRLFQEIREKRGLCYTVFAQPSAYSDTGSLLIYSGTGADKLHELVDVTLSEIRRIADDISDEEIARARAQIKAANLMGLESPSNRADRLARALFNWGYVPDLDEIIERIDAVDLSELRRFGQNLCQDGRIAMALYGQEPLGNVLPLSQLKEKLVA